MNKQEQIKKAKEYGNFFAYEGCHKIYILKDDTEIKEALKINYKIYPIKELEKVYHNSCSLKFISSWDLNKTFIKQFENE